ncbi:MAG TPA: S8 family serine peptidase [Actinomycetota bacterium]
MHTENLRRIRRWVLAIAVATTVTASGNHADAAIGGGDPLVVPGQALVTFVPGTSQQIQAVAHARAGAHVIRSIPSIGFDLVEFPDTLDVDLVLASYRSDPAVGVAEPNHRGWVALSPSDACHVRPCDGSFEQWHHLRTNTPFGWDAFPGTTFTASELARAERVTIAVLDTKVDAGHPDFANAGSPSTDARAGGQLLTAAARDWVPPSRRQGAAAYHGTFVAGLAAAATGNGIEMAGAGFPATILPLTVVDGSGYTDAASLADAILYAWQRGARVINLSLGLSADSAAVRSAIKTVTAGTTGTPASLVVAAAGNHTGSAPFYPGSYPESLSVSGTNADDGRAPCSNHNGNVSVAAPADRLNGLAPMPAARLQAPCGTSAAAPQVSGLAALLFAQDPSRSPAQVRSIIESSADDLGAPGRDDYFGHGRINIERAVRPSGPRASDAAGTVLAVSGGSSTVTAIATAVRPITRAQLVFDRPDATPIVMQAADGAFGGTTERVRATLAIPAGAAPGPHQIWVRAHDGLRWGAFAAGILAVDGTPPQINGATATDGNRVVGEPLRITFSLADDYSKTFTHAVEIRSTTTGAIVHRVVRADTPGGPQVYEWLPPLTAPGGHFTVKIGAADATGNARSTELGAILA